MFYSEEFLLAHIFQISSAFFLGHVPLSVVFPTLLDLDDSSDSSSVFWQDYSIGNVLSLQLISKYNGFLAPSRNGQ